MGPPDLPLRDGLLVFLKKSVGKDAFKAKAKRLELYWTQELGISPDSTLADIPESVRTVMLHGKGKTSPGLSGLVEQIGEEDGAWSDLEPLYDEVACPECGGSRLNAQARAVKLKGWTLGDLSCLDVVSFRKEWERFEFGPGETPVAAPISKEITLRLQFLEEVGLDYLSLDRSGDTLSGGETQRIRLASQLGTNLKGVCYILDEPTIGLHPSDNIRLLRSLGQLKEKGNTVIVVEHDAETMKQADSLVELGPEAGRGGGRVTARGTFDALALDADTLTGQWFGKPLRELYGFSTGLPPEGKRLEFFGASARNLQNIDVSIPLGTLTCITGVSGAGKSTLVHEVIYRGLKERQSGRFGAGTAPFRSMAGDEHIRRVLEVDHNPIGRTPRSVPVTYIGVWDAIRKLFAALPEAKARGFTPGRFSFNVGGGRCEECGGQGEVRVEMNFLPDVYVPCETCGGARFNAETLEVKFRGKSIADVLGMTMEEAARCFDAFYRIADPLKALTDLGLGYLRMGQPSSTLSGGEAQRIKLVGELGRNRNPTLYIFDEPTTGLHRADVKRLLDVLRALAAQGHTVLVIEHNMDFVRASDYVVDLGPGGGPAGGRVVVAGTPEELIAVADSSATARALREVE